jgi:3-methyl-2-oxobutanoate hydroxymethyltransferase
VDTAGIDVILVGDSASNVMAGHETTLPITLDQMIYHASSVVRAIERALSSGFTFWKLPIRSKEALRSSIRIMKKAVDML